MPKQSIVIMYHKFKDQFLHSLKLLKTTLPDEVEVVILGNNENEGELDFEVDTRYRYVKIYESMLCARAMNAAVELANGEIITMMDQDVFVFNDWYTPLLQKLQSDKKIGAVSPKMLNPTNNRILEYGIEFNTQNSIHIAKDLPADHPLTQNEIRVSTACSGVLMTTKKLYQQVNGLDKDMPYVYADCDYCLKLREIGMETWVVPSSVVYHKSMTSEHNSKSVDFSPIAQESRIMFFVKNYHRLPIGPIHWLEKMLSFFKDKHEIFQMYHFVNLSSFYEISWYKNTLKEAAGIDFFDEYRFSVTNRNLRAIQLYDILPYSFLSITSPIVYFVDSYLSLKDNSIWFLMRDISKDFIMDINCNIISMADLSSLDA